MDAILTHLLAAPPAPLADAIPAWWEAAAPLRDRFARPVDRALALGLTAPTPGAAFLGGYRAALHAMVPALGAHTRAALCASEAGGAHPRAIEARLEDGRLDGAKGFVTGARDADALLVLAARGAAGEGRRPLVLARVDPGAPGVAFEDMPTTPFVPDVAHCAVSFVGVAAGDVLPGDGWGDYVRPFRTLEDVHVSAALGAWLLGALRRGEGPRPVVERMLGALAALHALAGALPSSPAAHVALAGALAQLHGAVEAMDAWWPEGPERAVWARDRRILGVARGAREKRLARAWEALSPPRGGASDDA
ncbi:MAG: hypothetical protein U0324_38090 [Polyangiales bacterium]